MTTLKLVSQDDKEINLRLSLKDDDLAALRKRNEERAAAAKAKLGRNWLCHPANKVPINKQASVLEPLRRKLGT
jgi:hypothetical protein